MFLLKMFLIILMVDILCLIGFFFIAKDEFIEIIKEERLNKKKAIEEANYYIDLNKFGGWYEEKKDFNS